MAYIFVAGVLLATQIKGYFGKKTSGKLLHVHDAVLFNMVRMVLCVVIGLVLILIRRPADLSGIDGGMLLICFFGGVANAVFLVSWILAVKYNSYAMIDVALAIGSIFPTVLCFLFFKEAISWRKMIGFAILILALPILLDLRKSSSKKWHLIGFLLVVSTAVCDGLVNFSQQVYRQFYTQDGLFFVDRAYSKELFNFYMYLFSGIVLCLVCCGFLCAERAKGGRELLKSSVKDRAILIRQTMLYNVIMAACLYLVTYFQMVAANDYRLSAQILYPLVKGGTLVLSNVMAAVFFKERMTKRRFVGMGLALVGIVIMNVV